MCHDYSPAAFLPVLDRSWSRGGGEGRGRSCNACRSQRLLSCRPSLRTRNSSFDPSPASMRGGQPLLAAVLGHGAVLVGAEPKVGERLGGTDQGEPGLLVLWVIAAGVAVVQVFRRARGRRRPDPSPARRPRAARACACGRRRERAPWRRTARFGSSRPAVRTRPRIRAPAPASYGL
jgi:hypothetical protein